MTGQASLACKSNNSTISQNGTYVSNNDNDDTDSE